MLGAQLKNNNIIPRWTKYQFLKLQKLQPTTAVYWEEYTEYIERHVERKLYTIGEQK